MILTLFIATHVNILTSDRSTGASRPGFKATDHNAPELIRSTEVRRLSNGYISDPPQAAVRNVTGVFTERSATMRPEGRIPSFGSWLEPRYIFAAGYLD